MIPNHVKKRTYEVAHFFEDCEAGDWLNEKFEEGYVVDTLSSCVVPGRYDRRKPEVQMTIIMRLELPPAFGGSGGVEEKRSRGEGEALLSSTPLLNHSSTSPVSAPND